MDGGERENPRLSKSAAVENVLPDKQVQQIAVFKGLLGRVQLNSPHERPNTLAFSSSLGSEAEPTHLTRYFVFHGMLLSVGRISQTFSPTPLPGSLSPGCGSLSLSTHPRTSEWRRQLAKHCSTILEFLPPPPPTRCGGV